jgi:hypothetical protein
VTHHCHAVRCETPCKPEFLMCGKHWRRVPAYIQVLVWRHYRPGQCNDKCPSFEWCIAADAAVAAVARAEDQSKPWGTMFVKAFWPERPREEVFAAFDALAATKGAAR